MDVDSLRAAADLLAELRFTGARIDDLPAELRPRDLAAGYVIQDALIKALQARYGGAHVGYKIACTNQSAQRLLNTRAPVYGQLLSPFVFASPAQLKASDFTILGVETEFAFELAADVPPSSTAYTSETIAEYVGQAFPAIEIVGHRLASWSKFDAPMLVADNAVHGAWIHGAPFSDWRRLALPTFPVRLIVNRELKLTGYGANVLGHPLTALAWLANELPRWGRTLRAGERVTTGTCTDVYLAQPADEIRADFEVLGRVDVQLGGA